MTLNASANAALKHIGLMLNKQGRSPDQFGSPNVTHDNTEYDRLIASFGISEQAEASRQMTPNLTSEQRAIFDTFITSALTNGGLYMIDANRDWHNMPNVLLQPASMLKETQCFVQRQQVSQF